MRKAFTCFAVFVVLLVSVAIVIDRLPVQASSKPQFEYKVLLVEELGQVPTGVYGKESVNAYFKSLRVTINKLGAEGWRFMGIDGFRNYGSAAVFMKEK